MARSSTGQQNLKADHPGDKRTRENLDFLEKNYTLPILDVKRSQTITKKFSLKTLMMVFLDYR